MTLYDIAGRALTGPPRVVGAEAAYRCEACGTLLKALGAACVLEPHDEEAGDE